jgi:hypothetical protein
MATTYSPDSDLMHLLCGLVSRGEVDYLQRLGLGSDDIRAIKTISESSGCYRKLKVPIFKSITVNHEAIGELAKSALHECLLVEMITHGADHPMMQFYFGVKRRFFYELRTLHIEKMKALSNHQVIDRYVIDHCKASLKRHNYNSSVSNQIYCMLDAANEFGCPLRIIWDVINKAEARGVFSWGAVGYQ